MKKIPISVTKEILFLASKKLSLREIAEKIQLGKLTVSRYLKQAKIQKSSSKAGKLCTISSRLRDVLIINSKIALMQLNILKRLLMPLFQKKQLDFYYVAQVLKAIREL